MNVLQLLAVLYYFAFQVIGIYEKRWRSISSLYVVSSSSEFYTLTTNSVKNPSPNVVCSELMTLNEVPYNGASSEFDSLFGL